MKQVNTYSWHPDTRGPQVYTLYAADGAGKDFDPSRSGGKDPASCGWKKLAKVDTRPAQGDGGGQYGVSVSDPAAAARKVPLPAVRRLPHRGGRPVRQHVLQRDRRDRGRAAAADKPAAGEAKEGKDAAKYEIVIDTSEVPEMNDWAENKLRPVLEEWYPQIVKMLPSDGFTAPQKFSVTFRKDKKGVADTGGAAVNCAADWFKKNLEGEAKGAVVHEMVHVVQQYGRARRGGSRNPGWLVEGVADYIRWFKYEPESQRPHPRAGRRQLQRQLPHDGRVPRLRHPQVRQGPRAEAERGHAAGEVR